MGSDGFGHVAIIGVSPRVWCLVTMISGSGDRNLCFWVRVD